jgi:hypothetical protein
LSYISVSYGNIARNTTFIETSAHQLCDEQARRHAISSTKGCIW